MWLLHKGKGRKKIGRDRHKHAKHKIDHKHKKHRKKSEEKKKHHIGLFHRKKHKEAKQQLADAPAKIQSPKKEESNKVEVAKQGKKSFRGGAMEARMQELEQETQKKIEKMNESFESVKSTLTQIQKENDDLKKDKKFLIDKMHHMASELQDIPTEERSETAGKENVKETTERITSYTSAAAQDNNTASVAEKPQTEKKKKHSFFGRKGKKQQEVQQAAEQEPVEEEGPEDYKRVAKRIERENLLEAREKETIHPAFVDESEKKRVETPLDALLELVMKKGAVKISEAAEHFRVKEKQIEEWARVLEEHELVDLHYPTFGKPILKKKVE